MAVVGTEADALHLRFDGFVHSHLQGDELSESLGLDLSDGSFQVEVEVVQGDIRWRSTRSRFSLSVDAASRRAHALDGMRSRVTRLLSFPRERRRLAARLSPRRPMEVGKASLTARDATLEVDGARVVLRLGSVPGLSARNGRAVRELLLPWDVEGIRAGEVPLDLQIERAGQQLLTLRLMSIGTRGAAASETEARDAEVVSLATLLDGVAPARGREREAARPSATPLRTRLLPQSLSSDPDFAWIVRQPLLDEMRSAVNAVLRAFTSFYGNGEGGGRPLHVELDWWSQLEDALQHPEAEQLVAALRRALLLYTVIEKDESPPGLTAAEQDWRRHALPAATPETENVCWLLRMLLPRIDVDSARRESLERWCRFVAQIDDANSDRDTRLQQMEDALWAEFTQPVDIVPEGDDGPIFELSGDFPRPGDTPAALTSLIHITARDFDVAIDLEGKPLLRKLELARVARGGPGAVRQVDVLLAEVKIPRVLVGFQYTTRPSASAASGLLWILTGGLSGVALTTAGYGRATVTDAVMQLQLQPGVSQRGNALAALHWQGGARLLPDEGDLGIVLLGDSTPLATIVDLLLSAWSSWVGDDGLLEDLADELTRQLPLLSTPFVWQAAWHVVGGPEAATLTDRDIGLDEQALLLGGHIERPGGSLIPAPPGVLDPELTDQTGVAVGGEYLKAWVHALLGDRGGVYAPHGGADALATHCGVTLSGLAPEQPLDLAEVERRLEEVRRRRGGGPLPIEGETAPGVRLPREDESPPGDESVGPPPDDGGCDPAPDAGGPKTEHELIVLRSMGAIELPADGDADHVAVVRFDYHVSLSTVRTTPKAVPRITPGQCFHVGFEGPPEPLGGDPAPGGIDPRVLEAAVRSALGGRAGPAPEGAGGGTGMGLGAQGRVRVRPAVPLPNGGRGADDGGQIVCVPPSCEWLFTAERETLAVMVRARISFRAKLLLDFSPWSAGWLPFLRLTVNGSPPSLESEVELIETGPPFDSLPADGLSACLTRFVQQDLEPALEPLASAGPLTRSGLVRLDTLPAQAQILLDARFGTDNLGEIALGWPGAEAFLTDLVEVQGASAARNGVVEPRYVIDGGRAYWALDADHGLDGLFSSND